MNKLIAAVCTIGLVHLATAGVDDPEYVKPGSGVGFIAVVNAQSKVPEIEFATATATIRKQDAFIFKFVKVEAEAKGAAAVIVLVDKADEPPMTVSPEIGRAVVNVGALTADLKSEDAKKKFFFPRARREFLRAVAYAFCAGSSQFPNNLMGALTVRDLDFLKDTLPIDTLFKIKTVAEKRGMKPERIADYYTACEEGWAPKPKTPDEKKVWDEVHALPTKPITIEPEKK